MTDLSKSNWPNEREEQKRKEVSMSILCIGIVLNYKDLDSKKYGFFPTINRPNEEVAVACKRLRVTSLRSDPYPIDRVLSDIHLC